MRANWMKNFPSIARLPLALTSAVCLTACSSWSDVAERAKEIEKAKLAQGKVSASVVVAQPAPPAETPPAIRKCLLAKPDLAKAKSADDKVVALYKADVNRRQCAEAYLKKLDGDRKAAKMAEAPSGHPKTGEAAKPKRDKAEWPGEGS